MEATVGFAASLEAWSEIEANPWFRTLSKNAVSPAVKDVVKAQADATTNVGNIAVYEGTTMDETAQEYIMSVQMMAKAQANAKKKADALSKLDGPKRAKAEAADLTVSTHARTHARTVCTHSPPTHTRFGSLSANAEHALPFLLFELLVWRCGEYQHALRDRSAQDCVILHLGWSTVKHFSIVHGPF